MKNTSLHSWGNAFEFRFPDFRSIKPCSFTDSTCYCCLRHLCHDRQRHHHKGCRRVFDTLANVCLCSLSRAIFTNLMLDQWSQEKERTKSMWNCLEAVDTDKEMMRGKIWEGSKSQEALRTSSHREQNREMMGRLRSLTKGFTQRNKKTEDYCFQSLLPLVPPENFSRLFLILIKPLSSKSETRRGHQETDSFNPVSN